MSKYEYKISYFEYDETFIDSEVITVTVDEEKGEEPEKGQERAREEAEEYGMGNVDSGNIYNGPFFWTVELIDTH